MSTYENIIDVEPISYSSTRLSPEGAAVPRVAVNTYAYRGAAASESGYAGARKTLGSVAGGLVQIAAGAGLVMIGVPMLILPGPGLLAILGGVALAGNGLKKVLG